MVRKQFVFFLLAFIVQSAFAKSEMRGVTECVRNPLFIQIAKMQQPVAIDTQQSRLPGVVVRELKGARRVYRHPSWEQSGHVATSVRDRGGNIYTVPIPSISLDINPLEKRNNVYRIDSKTGEMSVFMSLPMEDGRSQRNPFGTLGVFLDCDTNALYVSSVSDSTPEKVRGVIYKINIETAEIESSLSNVDAIGVAVFEIDGKKRLYYGDARSSSVLSVPLLKSGDFEPRKTPRYEFSLLAIKNGDSTQVRKIRFIKDNDYGYRLSVTDTEFAFRLLSGNTRRFRHYEFIWNHKHQKWEFLRIRQS